MKSELRIFSDMHEHEKIAVDRFMAKLPKDNFVVLAGIYVDKDQRYYVRREIDLTLICPKGIFVIEMKDWGGTNKQPVGMNDMNIVLVGSNGHSTKTMTNPFQKVEEQSKVVGQDIRKKLNPFSHRSIISKLTVAKTIGVVFFTNDSFSLKVKNGENLLYFNMSNINQLWEKKFTKDNLVEADIKIIADLYGEGHGKVLKAFNNGTYVGDYKIESLLFDGENYKIYKAFNERMKRYYFLKAIVLSPEYVKEKAKLVEEMANRDKEAASFFEENNNILFSDFPSFTEGDYIINITKWIEHKTLGEVVKQGLSDEEKLDIINQLGRTIEDIHASAIVHRDLNNHNIILSKDNKVKIMNFDFAKLEGKMTMRNFILGKEDMYRAPELMNYNGDSITRYVDYYSLGVLIHELIKGVYPFKEFGDKYKFTLDFSSVNNDTLRSLEQVEYKLLSNAPQEREEGFKLLKEKVQW